MTSEPPHPGKDEAALDLSVERQVEGSIADGAAVEQGTDVAAAADEGARSRSAAGGRRAWPTWPERHTAAPEPAAIAPGPDHRRRFPAVVARRDPLWSAVMAQEGVTLAPGESANDRYANTIYREQRPDRASQTDRQTP